MNARAPTYERWGRLAHECTRMHSSTHARIHKCTYASINGGIDRRGGWCRPGGVYWQLLERGAKTRRRSSSGTSYAGHCTAPRLQSSSRFGDGELIFCFFLGTGDSRCRMWGWQRKVSCRAPYCMSVTIPRPRTAFQSQSLGPVLPFSHNP